MASLRKSKNTILKKLSSSVNSLKNSKGSDLKSNLILGLVVGSGVLSLISSSLPGELLKDVTKLFDYGVYDSKIDGIRNNMGCATIVGKAEQNGLACMQNLFNKCNNIRTFSFVTGFLLLITTLLLAINKNNNPLKFKLSLISIVCCFVLYLIINYTTYVMKNNSINDENCGLKDIDKSSKIKYGMSYYMNLVCNSLFAIIGAMMFKQYQRILF